LKKYLVIFLVFGAIFSQVSAMTWDEVITHASQRSNDIKSAQKQLEAYRWNYYKSYSSFLPQMSASYSQGGLFVSSEASYSYGLSVTQNIFSGLSNYYENRSAAVTLDYYQSSLQSTRASLYYTLREAFINLFVAQENIKVQNQIKVMREKNLRMIQLFYESGKEDRGTLMRTQAQLDEANFNLTSAKRQLEIARLKLSQIIENDIASAEGKMDYSLTLMPDVDNLSKSSPVYRMAKNSYDLADISQKATWSEFLPTVSLSGSYQKSGNNWPPSTSSKSVSLNVSYAFFPGGSNFADRAVQSYLLDKAREDFYKAEKDIFYTIEKAYIDYRDAIDAFKLKNTYLSASKERANIAQLKYLNGLTNYYEWDQIQNEFINNQIGVLNYQKSALLAEASWYKSYGGWVE